MNRVALSCLPSACPQSFGKPCAKRNGGDFLRNIDRLSQGGILAGNQGARFPRNLQAHTKFWQKFTLFWREFDFKVFPYFLSNEGILPITHNMQEIFSCHRKKLLGTASN